ncbi:CopY/TcrY family copper transport repressor [Lactobacillus sp. S2-2]|uniref:CopY/TcrY family copper transport repressor n=1 Tax=Lactobacillus sp. S2-2 TaxID=2692917 RepID=UPI001F014074|nr:CopY/TcrY family copper transport repressor [Lactobacillus sp. S2-2]MCF6514739.1 CopY/TcrY family copper transport repressor [Lactobacillus sp. S2-2]
MSEKEINSISSSEWVVMRIIWSLEKPTTNEIIKAVKNKKDWSESTIKTLLSRLVKKNLLSTNKVSRQFIYQPEVEESEAMNSSALSLFDNMCAMKNGQVISNIINNTEISKSDLKEIKSLIDSKLDSAPEMVKCDCINSNECSHN